MLSSYNISLGLKTHYYLTRRPATTTITMRGRHTSARRQRHSPPTSNTSRVGPAMIGRHHRTTCVGTTHAGTTGWGATGRAIRSRHHRTTPTVVAGRCGGGEGRWAGGREQEQEQEHCRSSISWQAGGFSFCSLITPP